MHLFPRDVCYKQAKGIICAKVLEPLIIRVECSHCIATKEYHRLGALNNDRLGYSPVVKSCCSIYHIPASMSTTLKPLTQQQSQQQKGYLFLTILETGKVKIIGQPIQ